VAQPLGLLCLSAHSQKRVALVIGNSAYQHAPRLENPKKDATDMAAVLKQLGFEAAPTASSRSLPLASLR